MALEEYAPNPEFLGRNFNAGEVVQLVLKDKSGRWLSFKFVQMVMMHELAHCKQMNHSRAFWQVRNQYADHMKELWTQRYEGEGVWGRGQNLISGEFVHDRMPDDADIPEHLCGGTYRRGRGRKRKRGQNDADPARPTYAERQQKRIKKKFGKHGEGHDLGEDELVRGALEKGKSRPGKPRVANSKRGRELRASAALARFDAAKNQQARGRTTDTTPELIEDGDSETESEEDLDDPYADGLNILETLVRIKDQRGRDLYQVCGDEGGEDEGGEEEMEELKVIGANTTSAAEGVDAKTRQRLEDEGSETEGEEEVNDINAAVESADATTVSDDILATGSPTQATSDQPPQRKTSPIRDLPTIASSHQTTASSNVSTCPICSLDNEASSATCMACSHVLKPSLMKSHWRCKSSQCHGSAYINAGDAGRCGLCGGLKPAAGNDKPMGLVGADVLRWD